MCTVVQSAQLPTHQNWSQASGDSEFVDVTGSTHHLLDDRRLGGHYVRTKRNVIEG